MRPLRTTTKTALLFSLVTSCLVLLLGGVFSIASYYNAERQIRYTLESEAREIIAEYLTYEDERIIYQNNDAGESLSKHLSNDNLAVRILNTDLANIGAFGGFENETYTEIDADEKKTGVIQQALTSGQTNFGRLSADGEDELEYLVLTYPLKYEGVNRGVLQIGRSTAEIDQLLRANVLLLLALLPLSVMLSFLFGMLQAKTAFSPVHRMLAHIHAIETHALAGRLDQKGHPKDELVQLAHAFNQMMDRVESGVLKQKQFIANASHELKTPMSKAVSSLDVALSEDSQKTHLLPIRDDLLAMGRQIDDLLTLARATELYQTDQVCTLAVAIADAVRQLSEAAQQNNVHIEVSTAESLVVPLAPEVISIVVKNLLSNAIKYSKPGQTVTVQAEQIAEQIKLSVQDQGIGMTTEEKEHLFDRFYRGKTGKRKADGSGIGLALVKDIADRAGLRITVESEIGQGTTVTVWIPTEATTAA